MQRAKRIYLLLGVLAVVCAAAFAVSRYQEEQERIRNTDEVVLEVDPDTVDSLSWTCEGESLAFHKDGSWLYDEDSAFPVDEEEITAYLRVNDSQILYRITGSEYEALMAASYNDLRHQEVLSADFADVTGLEVTLEGQTYTITSKGSGEDRTFLYNEEELDIGDLQDALEDLTATEFTDETPAEKEEISLTVSLDNETFPQVVIRLYRYDGETCLAVVDGSPVCLVERSAVVDLMEAVNAIVL